MTGGGSVFTTTSAIGQPPIGTRVTHGFELHCNPLELPNNLEINWDGGNNFKLTSLTQVTCTDDPLINQKPPNAGFDTLIAQGIGKLNGQAGATITFTLVDAGEPGSNDTAYFLIKNAGGTVVLKVGAPDFANSATLTKGNQQAHK